MNKKLILIALSAMMFCSASYAQKVIKDGSAVIIDCSEMDPKFYDSNKKPRRTDATDTSIGTNNATDISSLETNAKVYKKFEVQKEKNNPATGWRNAIDICASLNSNGTGWRLPTQRELMLMWILYSKLSANGISAIGHFCISATHAGTDHAWFVSLLNGGTDYGRKAQSNLTFRCIRDL